MRLHNDGKVSNCSIQSCGRSISACVFTKHKPYITSNLELQRVITLKELAHGPYFFINSICLVNMNMLARFDKIPTMTLQDIKETKGYRRTDIVKTVYLPTKCVCGGIHIQYGTRL